MKADGTEGTYRWDEHDENLANFVTAAEAFELVVEQIGWERPPAREHEVSILEVRRL